MLGDDEHPISFLFQPELRGGHVHVRVRAGNRPSRALAGELVFRPQEWATLERLLEGPPVIRMSSPEPMRVRMTYKEVERDEVTRDVWIDRQPLEIERPV